VGMAQGWSSEIYRIAISGLISSTINGTPLFGAAASIHLQSIAVGARQSRPTGADGAISHDSGRPLCVYP
jgi:hypothetical protein